MTTPRSRLDRIHVVSPCAADWERMIGTDRVRFCEHCNLSVHDVSRMTRREAEALVRASRGRLCMRYVRGADGRVDTIDAPPLVPITRRPSRVAAGAAALVIGMAGAGATASAQEAAPGAVAAQVSAIPDPGRPTGTASIGGVVTDPLDAVVAGVELTVKNLATGASVSSTTDEEGAYRVDGLEAGMYVVTFQAPGFRNEEARVLVGDGEARVSNVELGVGAIGGIITIRSVAEPLVWHADERGAKDGERETPPVVEDLLDDEDTLAEAIRSEVDVNMRLPYGDTLLMYAAGEADLVEALVEAGADVNARDEFGATALMRAALYDEAAPIRRLVRAGADVDAADQDGLTALMVAALDGNEDAVEALLLAGANAHARDAHGRTALDFAKLEENETVVEILEMAGRR
jgi:hypothetical protein